MARKKQSTAPGLHAESEDRHMANGPGLVPTSPAIMVLSGAMILLFAVAFFWLYRLQIAQTGTEQVVAGRVAEMLERMDLSGVDGQSSFEEVGLSLKALNNRLEEIWKVAGEEHKEQLVQHTRSLEVQSSEQRRQKQQLDALNAELNALGNLISDQKDEISGGLAKRIQEAGQSAIELQQWQQQAAKRLTELEKQAQQLEVASTSVAAYRQTTNRAIIRIQERLTLLEKHLSEISAESTSRRFPGIEPPLQE